MNPNIVFYNTRLSYQLLNLVNPLLQVKSSTIVSGIYFFHLKTPYLHSWDGEGGGGGSIIEALWKQENKTPTCKFLRLFPSVYFSLPSCSSRPPSLFYTQHLRIFLSLPFAPIAAMWRLRTEDLHWCIYIWKIAAWEIAHLGSCHLGNCQLGMPNTYIQHATQIYAYCCTINILRCKLLHRQICTIYYTLNLQSALYIVNLKLQIVNLLM